MLLIIDNCTVHSVLNNFKSVEVQFLSPVLQPMDQGIFKNFKTNYQKMIIRRMVAAIENKISYVTDDFRVLLLAKEAFREVTKKKKK